MRLKPQMTTTWSSRAIRHALHTVKREFEREMRGTKSYRLQKWAGVEGLHHRSITAYLDNKLGFAARELARDVRRHRPRIFYQMPVIPMLGVDQFVVTWPRRGMSVRVTLERNFIEGGQIIVHIDVAFNTRLVLSNRRSIFGSNA